MTDRQPLTAEGRMLLALVRHRDDEGRRSYPRPTAGNAGGPPGADVVAEAFRIAVLRMFGRPAPPWRMVRFAARRRSDIAPGHPFSAAAAYQVTSWAAGDTAALGRLTDDEVHAYALRLFVAVADELPLSDDELTDVIRAAERSAARRRGRRDA